MASRVAAGFIGGEPYSPANSEAKHTMPDSMPPFTLSSIFGSEPSSVPNAVAVKAAAAITAMHIASRPPKSTPATNRMYRYAMAMQANVSTQLAASVAVSVFARLSAPTARRAPSALRFGCVRQIAIIPICPPNSAAMPSNAKK